jgi:dTDP-6-deoxy-L-talose 4-dehydrogenase (NAD+)
MINTVAVTGATGFVGRHVVSFLRCLPGCRVVATGRDESRLKDLGVDYVVVDLENENLDCYTLLGKPNTLIHLAWEGLPRYHDSIHIERNLVASYRFISTMVQQGVSAVTVAGTCYEYGLQAGCLTENTLPAPITSYGIAKDRLRCLLYSLREHHQFSLCWARLFYMYGEGQSGSSLYSLLKAAVLNGDMVFNMSGGEQLRDYLPVTEVASAIVRLAIFGKNVGIVNVCSGNPVSIRRLVEQWLRENGWEIELNLGYYQYPDYEPMAFWGDATKLNEILGSISES